MKDIVTDPEYLDVSVPANTTFTHQVKRTASSHQDIVVSLGFTGDSVGTERLA